MKSVNTSGLVLGMLAVGGLIAGGAFMTGQAVFAQVDFSPTNAAAAANSNNQPVTQTNAATIDQYAKTKCKASVSDDDVAQVGDNTNTAANDCDTSQSASVSQSNNNAQTTTQSALAIACQANSLLASSAFCANTEEED